MPDNLTGMAGRRGSNNTVIQRTYFASVQHSGVLNEVVGFPEGELQSLPVEVAILLKQLTETCTELNRNIEFRLKCPHLKTYEGQEDGNSRPLRQVPPVVDVLLSQNPTPTLLRRTCIFVSSLVCMLMLGPNHVPDMS